MKVAAIGAGCFAAQNCTKHSQRKHMPTEASNSSCCSASFKGARAGANGVLGGIAGLGLGALLTAATGGLAVPLILGMAGTAAGCIGGSAAEAKRGENHSEGDIYSDTDYSDYYSSHYD